jgi:hypothetical protein
MDDFFASLPPWLGTIPQLFTAGGIMGILYILTMGYLGRGKNAIEGRRVAVEADKLENEIETKLRDHFAAELERMRGEIRDARDDAATAKERQLQCEEREQKLRLRVRKLEDDYTGLQRVISFNSSALLLESDGRPSEAVRQAAIKVLESLAKGEPPSSSGEKP